jgi:hypothetical protein
MACRVWARRGPPSTAAGFRPGRNRRGAQVGSGRSSIPNCSRRSAASFSPARFTAKVTAKCGQGSSPLACARRSAGCCGSCASTICLRPGGSDRRAARAANDGTIIPEMVDAMWGTDLMTTITGEGQAALFIAVDHCSAERVGIHAALRATRFEALEPIRQGVRQYFAGFAKAIARGLAIRHDHGSQYRLDAFQNELAFLGTESSTAFVRAPEGPDAQGEPPVSVALRHHRATPPRAAGVPRCLQRHMAYRTPWVRHASRISQTGSFNPRRWQRSLQPDVSTTAGAT